MARATHFHSGFKRGFEDAVAEPTFEIESPEVAAKKQIESRVRGAIKQVFGRNPTSLTLLTANSEKRALCRVEIVSETSGSTLTFYFSEQGHLVNFPPHKKR